MQRTGTFPAPALSTPPSFHFLPVWPFDAKPVPLVAMRLVRLAACRNDRSLRHDPDLRRTSAAGDPRAGLYDHLRARPAGDAQVLRGRDALRAVPRAADNWIEFRVGGNILALAKPGLVVPDQQPPAGTASVQLAFRVRREEVDAAEAALRTEGVAIVAASTDQRWGHRT